MESKRELLVFNKREIIVIIFLLFVVALFSFTLGLKLGKKLALDQSESHEAIEAVDSTHETPHDAVHSGPIHEEKVVEAEAAPKGHGEDQTQNVSKIKETDVQDAHSKSEELLNEEVVDAKAGLGKKIPMSYPSDKKNPLAPSKSAKSLQNVISGKYTLQVGSHREESEAADQVKELKQKGLDAFSIVVEIPEKGKWHRVGVGLFQSKEAADKSAIIWKRNKGLPTYIIQKIDSKR